MKEYKRNCPKCNKEIFYKRKSDMTYAEKHFTTCGKNTCVLNSGRFKEGKNDQKSPIEWWKIKLSDIDFNLRTKAYKNKQSQLHSGNKNPMFGKPAPQGSGNGWSGWYKDWFFRSLLELSYMISIIERFNLEWKSAESKEFKISYLDFNNKERNYFPDFIINNKYIVECKPKKLWNSPNVLTKKKSAENFCKKNGYIYKLTYCSKLDKSEIVKLYKEDKIKFLERYDKKFKEKYIGPEQKA